MSTGEPAKPKASLASQRLLLWRLLLGRTRQDSAKQLNLNPSHLRLIEMGQSMPGIIHAVTIERVTGVKCADWAEPPRDDLARDINRRTKGQAA